MEIFEYSVNRSARVPRLKFERIVESIDNSLNPDEAYVFIFLFIITSFILIVSLFKESCPCNGRDIQMAIYKSKFFKQWLVTMYACYYI